VKISKLAFYFKELMAVLSLGLFSLAALVWLDVIATLAVKG
jgi:hypothetical protein